MSALCEPFSYGNVIEVLELGLNCRLVLGRSVPGIMWGPGGASKGFGGRFFDCDVVLNGFPRRLARNNFATREPVRTHMYVYGQAGALPSICVRLGRLDCARRVREYLQLC